MNVEALFPAVAVLALVVGCWVESKSRHTPEAGDTDGSPR